VFEGFNQAAEAELTKVANGMVEFLSGDGWEQRLEQARQQLDASAESGRVAPLAEILAIPGAEHVVESMRLIDYCISKHLWASALEEAIFALVHSPTHLPIHIRMAEVLVAENKLQAAVDKYIAIAETYRIRGDLARAAQLMQQVLKYNSFDVGLRSRLIGMLVEQGRAEAALEQFMDLADTHYQLADLDAAYQAYGDALALAQQGAHRVWQVKFLHKMADIELQRLNWREAQRLYEQIKTLAPNDETARVTLIDLLFRFSTEKQAVAELDGYVRLLLSAKQGDRAVQMLEDFAQATPDSQIFVGRLAKTYQDLGRKAEAIRQYDQLGELQLQANQNAAARATIQTIISLGPDNLADYQQLLTQIPS
jgi:tetratricopeptide (TPR) repeat protein